MLGGARRRESLFFGWRVVGAAFVIAVFAWGVGFYGPSVFLGALHLDRGWAVSVISAAVTCHFLVSAGVVTRLPVLHRRLGVAAATRAGAISVSLGMLVWATASQPWQLFPAAFLTGTGFALTSGAAITAMVAPWFEHKRGAALALAFNGASIGGTIFAPLWMFLIATFGFVAAAAAVGSLMVVTVWSLAGRFLRPTPIGLGVVPDGDAAQAVGADAKPTRPAEPCVPLPPGGAVWSDWRFATLSIAFALGLFAQIGLFVNLVLLATPAVGAQWAGATVSLVTICAVAGRTVIGVLLPASTDWRVAAGVTFAVQAAGTLALLIAGSSSVPLFLLGCTLFGFGVGNLLSLPPLIAAIEFAPADVARVVALVTSVNQASYAFAPALLGVLRDLTAETSAPLVVTGLVQMAAAVVVLAGRRIRPATTLT
jgi:MFS family permease